MAARQKIIIAEDESNNPLGLYTPGRKGLQMVALYEFSSTWECGSNSRLTRNRIVHVKEINNNRSILKRIKYVKTEVYTCKV